MKRFLAITLEILTFVLFCVNGEGTVNLTTATFRDDYVSLMPTSLYKRIAVDRNVQHRTSSPEIFHKIDTMRRSRTDIWDWDYWCQLQPQTGNCSKNRRKYYYNTQLDQCLTFTYSGCQDNKNNFDTLVDCERHCKDSTDISHHASVIYVLKSIVENCMEFMELKKIERSMSCSLQSNAGLCVALFNKYYYDVNEGTCKSFVYSGCGGNQNRFATKYKCEKKCGKKHLFQDF